MPGVAGCFIGPNDLAASMGIGIGVPLESDHPRMVEAIAHVCKTAEAVGVAPGIHTSGAAGAQQRMEEGFRFIALASELKFMMSGLTSDLNATGWEPSERDSSAGASAASAVRY